MYKIPPLLKKGDCVAIVAPAGKIDPVKLKFGIDILEHWGFQVITGKNLFKESFYFSSSDENRLEDLQTALDNSDIRAIFCARGGYGTVRIIEKLDFTEFLKSPKWIIGFSDITYLLNKIQTLNVACIHGPMPASFVRYKKHSLNLLYKLLTEGRISYSISAKYASIYDNSKYLSFPVTGGNLTILSHCIGTSYIPNYSEKFLFIEDLNEEPYKIERFLYHLYHSGKLNNITGLIVGNFKLKKQTNFILSIENIIEEFKLNNLKIVLKKFPAGHGKINYPIIFNFPLNIHILSNSLKISQEIEI